MPRFARTPIWHVSQEGTPLASTAVLCSISSFHECQMTAVALNYTLSAVGIASNLHVPHSVDIPGVLLLIAAVDLNGDNKNVQAQQQHGDCKPPFFLL